MNAVEQAKAVRRSLSKTTMMREANMLILTSKPSNGRTLSSHGFGDEKDAPPEQYAELVCEETHQFMERTAAVLCEPGTWDVVHGCVLCFYGDAGKPREQWRPPYPRSGSAEYHGLGTDRFTLLVAKPGEDAYEMGEEIDVDAFDAKEAREMGKAILAADYEAGLRVVEVVGPRVGLYL